MDESPIALWCPLAPAVHPDWPTWAATAADWASSFGLGGGHTARGRARAAAAGELAGRTVLRPAAPAGAQFAADSLLWLFTFDDEYCDHGGVGRSPNEMAIVVADLVRASEIGDTGSGAASVRSLADLRKRLDALASPAQICRWNHSMLLHLGYQVWMAAHRLQATLPSIDEYVAGRIHNGGMEVCAVQLDIAEGYQVSTDDIARADVRALTEIASCVVGVDNDIISHAKEHDDPFNLIDVIAGERGHTPPEALAATMALRDAALALYLRLREQVRSTVQPLTNRYLDGLSSWIRANLDWSAHSARYRTPGAPAIVVVDTAPAPDQGFAPPPTISWWWDLTRG